MKDRRIIAKTCSCVIGLLLLALILTLSILQHGAEHRAMILPGAVAHAAAVVTRSTQTPSSPLSPDCAAASPLASTCSSAPSTGDLPNNALANSQAVMHATPVGTGTTPSGVTKSALQTIAGELNATSEKSALAPASAGEMKLAAHASAAGQINGVPIDTIVVMSAEVEDHVRQILAKGQIQGRNPQAFSKIGDSTMAWPPLLGDFDDPSSYRLGPYAGLQPTIEHFAGSFARQSAAVKKGMHTWTEYDPSWVNSDQCLPNEGPLLCEIRLHNPSVAIIRLGANDASQSDLFDKNMRRIVEDCLTRGIVPILGTKPDRVEGEENTINKLVYKIVSDYDIPLWDYDQVAATVPGKGLEPDHIHMQAGTTHDFTTSQAFREGSPLEDLTALMILDAIRQDSPDRG